MIVILAIVLLAMSFWLGYVVGSEKEEINIRYSPKENRRNEKM